MHPKLFEFIDQTMVIVHNAIAQFTSAAWGKSYYDTAESCYINRALMMITIDGLLHKWIYFCLRICPALIYAGAINFACILHPPPICIFLVFMSSLAWPFRAAILWSLDIISDCPFMCLFVLFQRQIARF